MRLLSAAMLLALSCVLCAASCVQGFESPTEAETADLQSSPGAESTTTDEPTEEAREPIGLKDFTPSEFSFVTTVRDDGKGPAGGWQEAKAKLTFIAVTFPPRRWPRRWQCPITVGMPLRAEHMGVITPAFAAKISAEVANKSKDFVDWQLPSGIFCQKFVEEVRGLVRFRYPKLGARVEPR